MSDHHERVLKALAGINWPGSPIPISEKGCLGTIEFEEGELYLEVNLTGLDRTKRHELEDQMTQALSAAFEGVEICLEVESNDVSAPKADPQPKSAPTMYDASKSSSSEQPVVTPKETALSGVKNIIGVASGKGGVGKSTVAANLALALQAKGASVGLCDLDIYGPSIPIQMGVVDAKPTVSDDHKKFIPVDAYGVKVMSIGFLVDDDTPVIWRGPIVSSVVKQFLQDVVWGDLDYLVIDLPPGTGDAQLSLAQIMPLDGAIIVTTPQKTAFEVAKRGARMFEKVNIPLLGVVENMSFFKNLENGSNSYPFGKGGGKITAKALDTQLLAEIGLDEEIREGGDHGLPIVVSYPENENSQIFLRLAEQLVQEVLNS